MVVVEGPGRLDDVVVPRRLGAVDRDADHHVGVDAAQRRRSAVGESPCRWRARGAAAPEQVPAVLSSSISSSPYSVGSPPVKPISASTEAAGG